MADEFRAKVEHYLTVTRTDPTTFGKRAMNDPRFVFDLRKGRSPSARTMDRVRAYMAANGPPGFDKMIGDIHADALSGEERSPLSVSAGDADILEEDRLRANWYRLLARLLARAPDAGVLRQVAGLKGDDSQFGEALVALAAAAHRTPAEVVAEEYFDLFIGVGQSELVPYGSYYLTGFLHEKPLARLRGDMARLGIARVQGVSESEDHIAALCEIMAGLISGSFGEPADLASQQSFFQTHIGCWAPRFFEDLEAARSAAFYMPVGTIGRLFMAVESRAFEMAA